ncbi:hypothetical protein C2S52_019814 [Perilla frutescens var. hirtella]|nr:hypothetical protein C2S52_019814 [Perilla frutescens var. hirtella]
MKKETEEVLASVWPKPQPIPYRAKIANFVNLIGNVKVPARFETDSDGKHLTSTVISLGIEGERRSRSLSIPVVFEGELAHVVACHVKENDRVFVSGQLSESAGKFHVVAENINFVLDKKKTRKTKLAGVELELECDSDSDSSAKGKSSASSLTIESNAAVPLYEAQSVAVESGNSNTVSSNQVLWDLWMNLVKNPVKWWDYRGHKSNGLVKEKFPDFKHKGSGEPLWITSAPKWILPALGKLEFDVKEMKLDKERKQNANNLDDSWKNLVENPGKWWDNRARKKNSKAPDFRHKETGDALWLNTSPDWALSKLPPVN